MTRKRTVKTVSFAANEYEDGLLEYATDPARGTFSQYVKRLIERDREGVIPAVRNVPQVARVEVVDEEEREAARGFI